MTYDPENKLFILKSGITDFDVVTDLYSDAKEDWLTDTLLNKFRFPLLAIGGQAIGGGKVISPYIMLLHGWKVRPQETDHTLTVSGNLITSNESSPFATVLGDHQVTIKSIVSSNSLTASGTALSASDLSSIIQGVWEASINEHPATGSAAKMLKDIKTKVTLASLK